VKRVQEIIGMILGILDGGGLNGRQCRWEINWQTAAIVKIIYKSKRRTNLPYRSAEDII
jgi:hypothetical protein